MSSGNISTSVYVVDLAKVMNDIVCLVTCTHPNIEGAVNDEVYGWWRKVFLCNYSKFELHTRVRDVHVQPNGIPCLKLHENSDWCFLLWPDAQTPNHRRGTTLNTTAAPSMLTHAQVVAAAAPTAVGAATAPALA